MATLYAKTAGGNWSAAATWSNVSATGVDSSGPPAAADNVILELLSGAVTIDSGAVCRSLDCSSGTGSYTGTLTHNAITLTVGDGTAGAGNVALKLVSGMTYTLISASSAVSFISTSATQQTITSGGKNFGNMTVNGVGSSYLLSDASSTTGGVFTLTSGTLNTNNQACVWSGFGSSGSVARTLTMGSSAFTIGTNAWSTSTFTNLTITANTAVITLNTADAVMVPGNNTINYNGTSLVFNSSGNALISHGGAGSVITFANITRTGTAVKTDSFSITSGTGSGGLVCTGAFTCNGNSATNRVLLKSVTLGSPVKITAATVTFTNTDFMDVTAAGVASPFTGTSMGDALGNTSITFDTPATQTHTASAGGNWSDATKWTSRVPLPQDNVVVDVNTTGTLTADMPRLGATLDFTGFVNTFTMSNENKYLYGSLTLASGMTFTSVGNSLYFSGRSSLTITSNGKSFQANAPHISATGGTYTLGDAFVCTGRFTTDNFGGTFATNNFAMSVGQFNLSVLTTLNFGSSVLSMTLTGADWLLSASGSAVINGSSATFLVANASASSRSFDGAAHTFGTLTYTVAGSTGSLVITGANTFGAINFSDVTNARTLTLPASTTTTITTAFNVNGTSGKLMTVNSSSGGTKATLSKTSGVVSCDYLSIFDSTASGGASWLAGANSVNN